MDTNHIGNIISERRKALGMTQLELSKKLRVTDRAVSRWERGAGAPDISLLAPLAEALEISTDELLTGKSPEQEWPPAPPAQPDGTPYCGKDCESCTYREELDCPGCKKGPGGILDCDCSLARCCRSKGHKNCETCTLLSSCGIYRRRGEMPRDRLRSIQRAEQLKKQKSRKAKWLSKWLTVLFAVNIIAFIPDFLSSEWLTATYPALFWPGHIATWSVTAIEALVLLRLSDEENSYLTASLCHFAGIFLAIISTLLIRSGNSGIANTLCNIPSFAAALFGTYKLFSGHSFILDGVDDGLAEKWMMLWKWTLSLTVSPFALLLLLIIIPGLVAIFELILILAMAIAALAVGIAELYFLYKTAKTFKTYGN